MSEIALEFDGVWKKFKRGEIHNSLRDLLPALTKGFFSVNGAGELQQREFWALQDINFQVYRGEAFGIIGSNGAGKSTALKLISRILHPNSGRITTKGRLSALIEVGAGFHPDLTGRENVYLNAAILGMNRREIARKFDEIVEFAGVADFIDTPVKRYSSGMYARLGFAVAAHVDPEILVVDEVLSVGDMQFQEKCFERMRSVVSAGTTVIFVSHNLQAIEMLCKRSMLLTKGKISEIGPTRIVLRRYIREIQGGTGFSKDKSLIGNVRLEDNSERAVESFGPGDRAALKFTLDTSIPIQECILAFIIQNVTDGQTLCDYNLLLEQVPLLATAGRPGQFTITFSVNLLRGMYGIFLNLYHSPTSRFLVHRLTAGLFSVHETMSYGGITHLDPVLASCDGLGPTDKATATESATGGLK
jgi:ABC-type polysaccharide/polyol phosphate transport system ATPase subunit